MVTCDIEEFSFAKYYPVFEKDTVEAIIIPIPDEVLQYFCTSPLILPKEACRNTYHDSTTERNYSVEWSDEDDSPELESPTFPEFSNKLKDAVNALGGQTFVKSNWHAPRDAVWMTTGRTMKCTSIEDIYLLLKSSDIICKDFGHKFQTDSGDRHCVVIKRWIDLHPGCEFRCFVKDHKLIAISQRDCSSFYAHINARKYDLLKDIVKFFNDRIKQKFLYANYVFDIAWLVGNTIVIIDFQPFDKNFTDSLLFAWEELYEMRIEVADCGTSSVDLAEPEPEFRFIGEDPGLQPKPCLHAGMPYEVKELCSEMGGMSLMDYLREEVRRQDSQPE